MKMLVALLACFVASTVFAGDGFIVFRAKNGNVIIPLAKHRGVEIPHELDKDGAHRLCKGCHEYQGVGPTKCGECHKRGNSGNEYITFRAKNGNVTVPLAKHRGIYIPQTLDKDGAHKLCKGCHEYRGVGPTKCGECHRR